MKNNRQQKPGRRLRSFALAGGLCVLLTPAQAQAHTTFPGLGEFASGFLHPLTTPPHLLVLLALGLWLGQSVPLRVKQPALVFGAMAALGLALTVMGRIGGVYPPIQVAVGLCLGAFVALAVPFPCWLKLVACGVTALVLGLDSGVEAGTTGVATGKVLTATWVSLVLCTVNVAFYVSLLPRVRWVQTGVRVVGSWIVAIAFLLLAFALRR